MKHVIILALLISSPLFAAKKKMLYGEDGRYEIGSFYAYQYKDHARAVAGKVKTNLVWKNGSTYNFEYLNLEMSGVNSAVPFSTQAVLTDCTGFLVAEDVMVTAGHCVFDELDCDTSLWLFDYTDKVASKRRFKEEDTVGCKEIISRGFSEEEVIDYAVIRLTRKMKGRTPLKFRTSGEVKSKTPVVMIGHPLGVPMKLTKGAEVWHTEDEWTFTANLDAFGGNSGSPVINEKTGLVEGILVRGGADFHDLDDGTMMVNMCDSESTNEYCTIGEDITRITKLNLQELLK